MKMFRKALRYWIALASVLSFLGGWVILAHSPKPVQPASVQPAVLSNLPPIQAFGSGLDNNNSSGFFPNNSQGLSQPSSGFPLLRTRGS